MHSTACTSIDSRALPSAQALPIEASLAADEPGADTLRQRHAQLVDRACALVQTRLDAPPTVAELCELLQVSRRTLQSCFQTALGINPLAYLRAVRLNAARHELQTASSVTEAATRLGFWHFGHFAHDYQAMFGELPSQTFRRHRPAAEPALSR